MRLQDIGENPGRIRRDFPNFWDTHAAEDRRQAVGLRNVISHDYGSIPLDLIWVVLNRDLGSLADSLRSSIL